MHLRQKTSRARAERRESFCKCFAIAKVRRVSGFVLFARSAQSVFFFATNGQRPTFRALSLFSWRLARERARGEEEQRLKEGDGSRAGTLDELVLAVADVVVRPRCQAVTAVARPPARVCLPAPVPSPGPGGIFLLFPPPLLDQVTKSLASRSTSTQHCIKPEYRMSGSWRSPPLPSP